MSDKKIKSLFEKLEIISKSLKDSTYKLIAQHILESMENGILKDQATLAKECFVSNSTITKFSKNLGFSGYREFLFLLKNQRTHFSFEKNYENLKIDTILKSISDWIKNNDTFIKKIVKHLKEHKFIKIYSSYQSRIASKYLNETLLSLNKIPILIHQEFSSYVKPIEESISLVNILLLTGRDNDTIIKKFIVDSQTSNNNFLIATADQIDKIENIFAERLIVDFNFDNSSFFYRTIALELLFLEIFHLLK